MVPEKTRQAHTLRDAALLALAAAVVAALLRALVWAAGRGLFDDGLGVGILVPLARAALAELPLVVIFFVGLSLAAVALRRWPRGVLFTAPVAAFYAFFTWGFVTLRLPVELFVHPEFKSSRGITANVLGAAVGLALASVVLLAVFAPRRVARVSRALRLVGLALLVGLVIVRVVPRGESPGDRPNVLLISIDTLRADHLASYGYGRDVAPSLTAFGTKALRFESAFTNHPWTLTAHATMLTGMLPSAHGVGRTKALDPTAPTLAGLMKDAGYRTFGVVDHNEWLNPRYGYARGFERYRRLDGTAAPKVEELLDCIDDATGLGGPFFGFAHFYDVHSDWSELPYDSDPDLRERFAGWYTGDFTGCDDELGCASEYLVALNARGESLAGDDLRYTKDLYDAGIATLDRQLGKLFVGLEERGLFENTVVILTADHGEEFFEHGQALHGQHYDECLHVPLFVRAPGGQHGAVTDELVGLVDLMPTVLDFAGLLDDAPDNLQGRSLAPLARDEAGEVPPGHAILMDTGNGIFGLRTSRYAVVRAPGVWRLFDTDDDPEQLDDLFGRGVLTERELEVLRAALRERRDATLALGERFSSHVALEDPDHKAAVNLAKLGYLDEVTDDEGGADL
jgi:arylsulfatase A-like enzyme